MSEQAVVITDQEITLEAQFFITKDHALVHRELFLDVFTKHYHGQRVKIIAFDGENLIASGFMSFLDSICKIFNIDNTQVDIITHHPGIFSQYRHSALMPGIFNLTRKYLTPVNYQLDNPKFVGTLLGRFNITRLRTAYELDINFPDDTYIIFQPVIAQVLQTYKHYERVYQDEFTYLKNKTFDQDMPSENLYGTIGWQNATANYHRVWPRYQIEVVTETDALSNYWLTEKTAKCLATGKPFVLVGGTGILEYIKLKGFKTFDCVIDESYDLAATPTQRIQKICESLKELYTSSNRSERIAQMYEIAKQNINIYRDWQG